MAYNLPARVVSERAGVGLESETVSVWPFGWKNATKVFDLPIS